MHTRKLPHGRWQAIEYLGRDDEGKQRYTSATGATATEARVRVRGKIRQRGEPRSEPVPHPEAPTPTLGRYLDTWLQHQQLKGNQRKTIQTYSEYVRNYLQPGPLAAKKLTEVSSYDLDTFYLYLQNQGRQRWTIRKCHAILHQAFRLARRHGLLDRIPTEDAQPPKMPVRRVNPDEYPSLDEVRLILKATEAHDVTLRPVLRFIAAACCRPGEACGLWWRDLDFTTGDVTIRASLDSSETPVRRKETKTQDVRRVPLDPATLTLLAEWRDQRPERLTRPDQYVFSDRGLPLRQDTLRHRLRKVCELGGVSSYPPLAFRHFGATTLLSQGVPVREVAERLGHKNPVMTLNVYAHSVPAVGREAADLLGRLLD